MKTLGTFVALFKSGFTKLAKFISSPQFRSAEAFALTVVSGIMAIAPNHTIEQALDAYDKYGIPVTHALADGKLDSDETKAALGFLAQKVISRAFPELSTTQANLLVNAAYDHLKGAN